MNFFSAEYERKINCSVIIQYLCFGLFLGLLSWNVLECHVDLEDELNNLLNHGPEGESARHGKRGNLKKKWFLF